MSQHADSKLIETLKEWGIKKLPQYVELLKQSARLLPVQLLFYLSLVADGCSSIGRIDEEVVLKCNNKVVRILMYETLWHPEEFEEFRSVIEEILRLRILPDEEREELFDKRMHVEVILNEIPPEDQTLDFLVYGNKYAHLLNLGNISVYLTAVDIRWNIFSTNPSFDFWFLLSRPPKEISLSSIRYVVEPSGAIRLAKDVSTSSRLLLLEGIPHEKGEEEKVIEESVNMIIKALNEKYYVVDDLLRDVEEILNLNIKGLVITLLY
ncbi:MAG: hypothetical protein L7H00_05680 [Vulcanisaeta sp.]|nr:hypothetical protein [Vulcanisaeta sp.]